MNPKFKETLDFFIFLFEKISETINYVLEKENEKEKDVEKSK